jgi:hypothetical protein
LGSEFVTFGQALLLLNRLTYFYLMSHHFSTEEPAPKNENDLNTSNQPQEEATINKEKPKTKTKLFNGTSDEKRSQDLLTQPREEVKGIVENLTMI